MSKNIILAEIENKFRNDSLISIDDWDSTQLFEVLVDDFHPFQDEDEDEFAQECRALFGE
jgi:hypothetical protein